MLQLCCLTYDLFLQLVYQMKMSHAKKMVGNSLCVGLPIVLVVFGYALDTDDPDTPNAVLNVARHGFSCSMRFPSMSLEWVGVWARTFFPVSPCKDHTSSSVSFLSNVL